MHELRFFPARRLEPYPRPPRLKRFRIRARRNFHELARRRQPHLDVISLRRRESHVRGAQLHHPVMQAQPLQNSFGVSHQRFQFVVTLLRPREFEHLHLLKLVLSLQPARVASRRPRFRPETRRPRAHFQSANRRRSRFRRDVGWSIPPRTSASATNPCLRCETCPPRTSAIAPRPSATRCSPETAAEFPCSRARACACPEKNSPAPVPAARPSLYRPRTAPPRFSPPHRNRVSPRPSPISQCGRALKSNAAAPPTAAPPHCPPPTCPPARWRVEYSECVSRKFFSSLVQQADALVIALDLVGDFLHQCQNLRRIFVGLLLPRNLLASPIALGLQPLGRSNKRPPLGIDSAKRLQIKRNPAIPPHLFDHIQMFPHIIQDPA